MYSLVFWLLSLGVLPWWGAWLVAPHSEPSRRLAAQYGVAIALGIVYALLLLAWLVGAATTGEFTLGFDGLRTALSTPFGFLAGWTHYLAFDLFVGAWIVRESVRIGVAPRLELLLTFLVGPIGLTLFLLRRARRSRRLDEAD